MKIKHLRIASIVLSIGMFASGMLFGGKAFANIAPNQVYAEEVDVTKNEVSSTLCSSNGALDSVNYAVELEYGVNGLMKFTPVATGVNRNGQSTYSGTISATFCLVTPDEDAFYTINLQNRFGEALSYSLYDARLNKVKSVSIQTGSDNAFNLKLRPNTLYYVVVSGSNKDLDQGYSVVKATKTLDDAGDSFKDAVEVELDQIHKQSIGMAGDVDYFKLTTPDVKAFYKFTGWSTSTDTAKFSIYNQNKKQVTTITAKEGQSSSVDVQLKRNTTYYIEVHGNTNTVGKYKFRLTCKEDDISDSRNGAMKLSVGNVIKGNAIQTSLDQDVYKVNTGKHTALCLKVNNNSKSNRVLAYVTDADGTIMKSAIYANAQQSAIFELTGLDKKSNYYIVVKGADGDAKYSVSAKLLQRNITYQTNEGKLAKGSPKTYIVSESKKLLTPTRSGYKFEGWYTNFRFLETSKVLSIPETATNDITLYAKWSAK